MRTVNFTQYTIDTPISEWFQRNKLSKSPIHFKDLSNILPLVSAYKYGGIYLSLDVIVQKNLGHLGNDFIGGDWPDGAGDGTLHLKHHGIKHKVSQHLLRYWFYCSICQVLELLQSSIDFLLINSICFDMTIQIKLLKTVEI